MLYIFFYCIIAFILGGLGDFVWAKWSKAIVDGVSPTDTENINSFNGRQDEMIEQNDYPLDMIINMDESPVGINQPIKRTLNKRGAKQVAVKTLEANNRKRISLMLAMTKSGRMLQPVIIEESQSKMAKETPGDTRMEQDGCTIYKQVNNTNTSHIMLDWIKNYLSPQFPGISLLHSFITLYSR